MDRRDQVGSARKIALVGSIVVGMLAIGAGNLIQTVGSTNGIHFHDPFAIWKMFGPPTAFAAALATWVTTRGVWWSMQILWWPEFLWGVIRTVLFACLLLYPAHLLWFCLQNLWQVDSFTSGREFQNVFVSVAFLDAVALFFGVLPAVAGQLAVMLIARKQLPTRHLELSKEPIS